MTERVYSPYKLAIELGFSEKQAQKFKWNGTDATNMRRIANHLGLPSTKPTLGKPDAQGEGKLEPKPPPEKAQLPKHKHYYRKNGVCSCGAVRKAKK